jgi:hypothetical protein
MDGLLLDLHTPSKFFCATAAVHAHLFLYFLFSKCHLALSPGRRIVTVPCYLVASNPVPHSLVTGPAATLCLCQCEVCQMQNILGKVFFLDFSEVHGCITDALNRLKIRVYYCIILTELARRKII